MADQPSVADDLRDAVVLAKSLGCPDAGALARELYGAWYVRSTPSAGRRARTPSAIDLNLADAYRAAHAQSGVWIDGWVVNQVSNHGRIMATRGDEQRVLDRVDVLPRDRPCLPPRVGDPVSVTARRDALSADGGSWISFGPRWDPETLPFDCVRFYFNVDLPLVLRFVAGLTTVVGDARLAIKLPAHAEAFGRADTAVVYVDGADLPTLGPLLQAAHEVVAPMLRANTPRLAARLDDGWAVAEDPGTGESFGEHRCRLVAEGIFISAAALDSTIDGQVVAVVEHLADVGLDPNRLHLNPQSTREFGWPTP